MLLLQQGMFQRAKVQKFESQSQPFGLKAVVPVECFKEQKYKNLKANHNKMDSSLFSEQNVSKSKSTKI